MKRNQFFLFFVFFLTSLLTSVETVEAHNKRRDKTSRSQKQNKDPEELPRSEDYWKSSQSLEESTTFSKLRFTNRAQCALDSEKPAQDFLLIVSHQELGKALYRLSKRLDLDSKRFIQEGLISFQTTLTQLIR
ncbi:MAG: hypothetical protein ACPGJV_10465, partial [Bacteriovoracaceae bacterium]